MNNVTYDFMLLAAQSYNFIWVPRYTLWNVPAAADYHGQNVILTASFCVMCHREFYIEQFDSVKIRIRIGDGYDTSANTLNGKQNDYTVRLYGIFGVKQP